METENEVTTTTRFSNIKARAQRAAKTVGKDVLIVGSLAVAAIGIGVVTSKINAHFDPDYAAYKAGLEDAELDAGVAELMAMEAADQES